MITLGGYALNSNIIWTDRDSWSPIVQTVKRTLGGKIVVASSPLEKGRPITLTATQDQGWITLPQRNILKQMAEIPGAIFVLVIDDETFNVMFRHEEPPAVDFKPLIDRTNPEVGDYFLGQIKLIEI